jgi:hypothetical protein
LFGRFYVVHDQVVFGLGQNAHDAAQSLAEARAGKEGDDDRDNQCFAN